jgi:hypothetical protein
VFKLSKWYLDCVTESGEAAVLYWAALRWGILRLRYGAALVKTRDADTVESYTLRPGTAPREIEGGVHWACRALNVDGSWVQRADGFERTLFEGKQGKIHWNCVTPRADATIRIGERTLCGMGYAECLTMTLKPWQLPFQKLRWGRFHSPADVLVWIEWCGSLERSWVFLNGEEDRRGRTSPSCVESKHHGAVLAIDGGSTLRSARLVQSLPLPLRALMWLLPGWRSVRETKSLARGSMTVSERTCTGLVVHEVVEWA